MGKQEQELQKVREQNQRNKMNNTNTLKIKRLGNVNDLVIGDIVILNLRNGEDNDSNQYNGFGIFIGKRLTRTQYHGFDFCSPMENSEDYLVGYHINSKDLYVPETGSISSKIFFTYGCKQPQIKDLELLK